MSFFHSSTCSSDAFSWSQQRHGRELRRRKEQEIESEEQKKCKITAMQRPCKTMRPKGHMLDFFQLVKYIRIYIYMQAVERGAQSQANDQGDLWLNPGKLCVPKQPPMSHSLIPKSS